MNQTAAETGGESGERGPARRQSDELARRLSRRYGDALRAADSGTAAEVARSGLAAGLSGPAVHARVVGPAMEWIGEMWERDLLSVADEHLATAITHRVLAGMYDSLMVSRPHTRPRIVLAAVEGQRHVVGLRMVADVLEGAGFRVTYLGGDVPVDSLADAVARRRPAIVGLSVTMPLGAPRLEDSIEAVAEAAPEARVVLGGRGVPASLRGRGFAWARDSEDVVRVFERVLADGQPRPLLERRDADIRSAPPLPAQWGPESREASFTEAAAGAADVARRHARRAAEQVAEREQAEPGPTVRRAFDERIAALGREAVPAALLIVDVDALHSVNERHGRPDGDRVLREVGEIVASEMRSADIAARLDGGEFGALLPGTSLDEAARIAERVRAAIAARSERPPVTVSVGVAGVRGDRRAAMLEAGWAVYRAKTAGGNCVRPRPRGPSGAGRRT